jgi:hypothetical protein
MDWTTLRAAFRDETEKIAEISLAGVSPQAAEGLHRPPMETQGLDKARRILAKAEMLKTASEKKRSLPLPSRALAAHVIAGGTIGRMLAEMSFQKSVSPTRKTIGTLLGMGAGVADHQLLKRRQTKTAAVGSILSPGMALRASQQVGRVSTKIKSGPSLPRSPFR